MTDEYNACHVVEVPDDGRARREGPRATTAPSSPTAPRSVSPLTETWETARYASAARYHQRLSPHACDRSRTLSGRSETRGLFLRNARFFSEVLSDPPPLLASQVGHNALGAGKIIAQGASLVDIAHRERRACTSTAPAGQHVKPSFRGQHAARHHAPAQLRRRALAVRPGPEGHHGKARSRTDARSCSAARPHRRPRRPGQQLPRVHARRSSQTSRSSRAATRRSRPAAAA